MLRPVWLGCVPYARALRLQEAVLAARRQPEARHDVLLLLEHPPTITIGRRRGAADNILDPTEVEVVQVSRGGDVTWHDRGQLVAYPIIALEDARQDLRDHLSRIETGVMATLTRLGLAPHRDPRNTGVWLPCADQQSRKVCSIGVACRQWVTWHGLALNVDNELEQFSRINPCGFDADVMTRLEDHASGWSVADLVPGLAEDLAAALARGLAPIDEVIFERDEEIEDLANRLVRGVAL
ncbi:MAG: lipoyl(octanoyl) transferase LipB [Myxococcota bacterium]